MTKQLDLAVAFRLAVETHGSQFDKAAEPYMFQVCRVAATMHTDEERAVALLRCVLKGVRGQPAFANTLALIWNIYGQEVFEAVFDLNRDEGESYRDYIHRVAENPLATRVMIGVLRDHLSHDRMRKLPPKKAMECENLYREALNLLTAVSEVPSPEAFNAVYPVPTRAASHAGLQLVSS